MAQITRSRKFGQQFSVTPKRMRHIAAKGLPKLKHPSRSRKMRSFLDQ
jgi:DNA-directed RNA polymerase sigma subunit (sigma70/sigma32)